MKIYKLKIDVNNYKGCYISKSKLTQDDFDKIDSGEVLNFDEDCISFVYADDEDLELGDVLRCWDFGGFIINNKACNLLSKNERIKVQFIRLQNDFILLNNLLIVDALDKERTEYKYFDDDIMGVKEYAFKELDYPPLFQITLPDGYVELDYFVTDEFIQFVNDNNIKGFLFKEVWDSKRQ